MKHTDKNGYTYTTVENDENKVRIYTLQNGLMVYLAQNFDAPRIQTYIPVRTGSNNDPADNTGLAHYLEHMMFKGTSKIGTKNWQEEKKYLDQIAQLFEEHKAEQNPDKKREIYKKIDHLSQKASKFAIANEYDRCLTSLGATGTNAHTWLNETVYKNNIPNNELEKWLKVEKERFSEMALRLFHTELESVYEEFNRIQDNDSRVTHEALMKLLFPTHPNGQQTTIGQAEHLKNPSMKAIYQYFDTYYVPNNYALILVGDLQFDDTIKLVDQYFGKFQYKPLPKKIKIEEKPIHSIKKITVKTPTIPRVQIAWRTDNYGTEEWLLTEIIANILSNKGEAGLLDLNVNNAQKALYSTAFTMGFNEYGYFSAIIIPKEDETLQKGIERLLAEIENVKKGNFPDWMLTAIVNDFKLQRMKALETADGLASNLYQTYIREQDWADELAEIKRFENISKEQIMAFAQNFFKENYIAVYKEKGENEEIIRVENPEITPIVLNREEKSDFLKNLLNEKTPEIKPHFIDYQKEIETVELKNRKVNFVKNKYNDGAEIHYIFPFGKDSDKELSLAVMLLQYLGTEEFSPNELKQEFYKLGISNDFKITSNELIISIKGLENNIAKGLKLLHHWLKTVQPDQEIYQNYVKTILESREAFKKDKNKIMSALQNYAKFGRNSRFRDVVSTQRLQEIKCDEITKKIKTWLDYPYQIFVYGKDFQYFKTILEPFLEKEKYLIPERKNYPEPKTEGKTYFVNYDMVQMEICKVGKTQNVEVNDFGKIGVFNEYFGSGLSSIVFQEIRESKSLAYAAYAFYQSNSEKNHADYILTYIGTQPDKLQIAVETMDEMMADLPQFDIQFQSAKASALKKISTSRITRTNIFFNYLRLNKLGVYYDLRKSIYSEIEKLNLVNLAEFYNEKIKPVKYNTVIMGKRENLDQETLRNRLGNFEELSLEELFGY